MFPALAEAVVCATGDHTEFGKIAHLTQTIRHASFPLQRDIAFLSRVLALLAAALGIVFFLIGLTIPLSFTQNLLFAIGIIVANVPEGLLPTVTLALAMGAQRMARRNVVIRHLPAVETLGSATVICTDKTGTLTENRMHVRRLYLAGAFEDVKDERRTRGSGRTPSGVFCSAPAVSEPEGNRRAGGAGLSR